MVPNSKMSNSILDSHKSSYGKISSSHHLTSDNIRDDRRLANSLTDSAEQVSGRSKHERIHTSSTMSNQKPLSVHGRARTHTAPLNRADLTPKLQQRSHPVTRTTKQRTNHAASSCQHRGCVHNSDSELKVTHSAPRSAPNNTTRRPTQSTKPSLSELTELQRQLRQQAPRPERIPVKSYSPASQRLSAPSNRANQLSTNRNAAATAHAVPTNRPLRHFEHRISSPEPQRTSMTTHESRIAHTRQVQPLLSGLLSHATAHTSLTHSNAVTTNTPRNRSLQASTRLAQKELSHLNKYSAQTNRYKNDQLVRTINERQVGRQPTLELQERCVHDPKLITTDQHEYNTAYKRMGAIQYVDDDVSCTSAVEQLSEHVNSACAITATSNKTHKYDEDALFLIQVYALEDDIGGDSMVCSANSVKNDMYSDKSKQMIDKYKDVFPDDLPKELPPKRSSDFKILLKEGSKPVTKAPYRMSSVELAELKKQLDDLRTELRYYSYARRMVQHACAWTTEH
jgi:hypothetical protein